MMFSLKLKILKCPWLLKIVGLLSLLLYNVSFRLKVKGSRNSMFFHPTAIFNGGNTEVKGNNNIIKIHSKVRLRKVKIEVFGNNNKLIFNEGVKFYEKGYVCFEGDNCTINIGKDTTIGSASLFCGESNTSIFIGEDCMLSRDISITTSDFHSIIDSTTNQRINLPKNVIIGDKVWIGYNVGISKGALLNNNSIIASRAVVTGKEYPASSILAGIPAKVIKNNVYWLREKISQQINEIN
jgi:acetyltransferase-like isoleucine patch superfamily enzyme